MVGYRGIAFAAALNLTLLAESRAHACGGGSCTPSLFLPLTGSVPSNALEFLWRPGWSQGQGLSNAPHLYKLENGQRSELAIEVLAGPEGPEGPKRVRPTQPVALGTTLLLESAEPACSMGASTPAMVTVGETRTLPSALGTLQVVESHAFTVMHIPTNAGSCSDDFEVANARLKLTLDAAAEPFAGALRHALLVDGKKRPQPPITPPRGQWPAYTLEGRLEDVLYTLCTRPSDGWTNDIAAGSHRVQWLATLPDGTELRSNEVSVELRCGQSDAGSGDAGRGDAGGGDADASAAPLRPDETTTPAPSTSSPAVSGADDDSSTNEEVDAPNAESNAGCSVHPRARVLFRPRAWQRSRWRCCSYA